MKKIQLFYNPETKPFYLKKKQCGLWFAFFGIILHIHFEAN